MQQEQLAAAQGQVEAAQAQAVAAEQAAARAQAEADAAQQLQLQLQADLQAAVAVQGAGAAAMQDGDGINLPEIPRPPGTGWSIQAAMELGHSDYAEIQVSLDDIYAAIPTYNQYDQRTIRTLVVRAQLDWTDDFRRQDPERLATFFRAVSALSRSIAY